MVLFKAFSVPLLSDGNNYLVKIQVKFILIYAQKITAHVKI